MKKIAILILNFNGKKDTLECLESIYRALEFKSLKVLVVVIDNGSTDNSIAAINKKFSQVKVIENKKNFGFAEGNNVGIRYALKNKFDYVLLLNNDTLVKKDFLVQLIKVAKKSKKTGIISPKIYFASGNEYHKDQYKEKERGKVIWYTGGIIDWDNVLTSHRGVDEVDKGQYEKIEKTEFATGCCMLIKRKVFEEVGLLDKKYFLYLEDVDLCHRAKQAGFKIYFVPQAIIWHKNASSSAVGSSLQDYYLTRNRLLFGMKYACLRTKLALLKEGFQLLVRGRKGQKEGTRDFFLFHFGER